MRAGSGTATPIAGARTVRLAREIAAMASRQGWQPGRHVTELELAAALRVSRTPVRAALRLLQAHGAVEARPNRGFFLLRGGNGLAGLSLNAPASAEDALHARVLRDRVTGRLPAAVTPSLLAARYGAGRAALDRVLSRLEEDGLLTRSPGRAWRFTPSLAGQGGVRASYEVRLLVEPGALLLPGTRIPVESVVEQRRRHQELVAAAGGSGRPRRSLRPAALFELDAGFHQMLADCSVNPFVAGLVSRQNALRRLLEFDSYRDLGRVVAWTHEHLAILDALAAGDVAGAADQLRSHLQRAADLAAART